jgi:hypothetical protein
MPKSKHRRKLDGKAVAHPGRGKPGKPLNLSWFDELEEGASTSGLPLFDWAETKDRPAEAGPDE